MTRRGVWLAAGVGLAAAGAAVPGCSEKPRDIKAAKEIRPDGADTTVEIPKGPSPAQSDLGAAKIVADAVAAHTGGNTALLEKLRTAEVERSGIDITSQNQSQPSKLVWHIRTAWPDRYRVDATLPTQMKMTICRAGETAWVFGGPAGDRKETIPSGQMLRGVIADDTYELLLLLTPLADPTLVAALAADTTIGGRPAVGVWLSSKTLPRAVAHFDKETKLLVQFTYEGNEGSDVVVVKEVRVTGTKVVNGVTLPEKLSIKWNGRPAVEWTVNKIEFPVDLPAKVFEDPQK